ncbi:heavy metal-associated isoprenylated plant protein 3 [Solanum lycopersicum]|uniref:HMA domain-containing protein n=1 Tax=Solanum lycopersicum TaxID=4081 RepID=A0A3Q7IME3_SOLLC|nr:heavy metal-associated isoprenylated plant protein 3 [Solanum lycopersicum]
MGEEKEKIKVEKKKNEAGKKSAGGGKNADDNSGGIATILLKLDLHCEGCAQKVRRSVRHFEGVEDVKADASTGKLTVKGNVDPLWLREKVESKTKKKVALLSAQPKKVAAGEKKSDEKVEKKAVEEKKKSNAKVENEAVEEKKKSDEKVENKAAEEKKGVDKKPNKVQCNNEVIQQHCNGPVQKLKRFLIKKLKRNVSVVRQKKGNESCSRYDNKKNREMVRDGKKKHSASCSTVASRSTEPKEQKTEVMNSKKECHHGGYINPNMCNQNHWNQNYGATIQDHHGYYGLSVGYMPPPPYITAFHDHGYGFRTGYVSPRHFTAPRDHDHGCSYGYGHSGYVPPPYSAPQYFSDENPNACSVM